MALSQEKTDHVERVLKASLRRKFADYRPEPAAMPFHTRLLGKDRLALYSFIHSLSTNFGTSVFEPVAVVLAAGNFKIAKSHTKSGDAIYEGALFEIQRIMDGLATAEIEPDKNVEIESIRRKCQAGAVRKVKPTVVDLYLEAYTGELYMFDLKTAKPNAGGFREFKRTLLEWVAATLAINPKSQISTLIAIPYNPYEPEPYRRWTMRGMLDLPNELKVAEEFWDFLGGSGTYSALLDCFERVGIELRDEIDRFFKRFGH
jgi:type II restriction enzyme